MSQLYRLRRSIPRLLANFGWLFGGRVVSGIVAFAAIRIITELLSPVEYGRASLALGVSATFLAVGATPFLQAIMRLHPEAAHAGTLPVLLRIKERLLLQAQLVAITLGGTAAAILAMVGWLSPAVPPAVALLAIAEIYRNDRTITLNIAGRHRDTALLQIYDALLRLLGAVTLLMIFAASGTNLVLGYAIGTLAAAALIALRADPPVPQAELAKHREALTGQIWQFARPLLPSGILSCVVAFGDRYLLATVLTLHDVGVYAAAYGLTSRAFAMLQNSWELAIRPDYLTAVVTGHAGRAQRHFSHLLLGGLLISAAMTTLIVIASERITALLLADSFSFAATILPWFAFGQSLRMISSCLILALFAYKRTRVVLAITLISALTSIVSILIGAMTLGVLGAAIACPVYFGVELLILLSIVGLRGTVRRSPR